MDPKTHDGTEHNGRTRLPNRRPNHTQTLEVGGHCFEVNVGFDPAVERLHGADGHLVGG